MLIQQNITAASLWCVYGLLLKTQPANADVSERLRDRTFSPRSRETQVARQQRCLPGGGQLVEGVMPAAAPVLPVLTRPRYSSSRPHSTHFSTSSRLCSSLRLYWTVTRAWRRWFRPGDCGALARFTRRPTR